MAGLPVVVGAGDVGVGGGVAPGATGATEGLMAAGLVLLDWLGPAYPLATGGALEDLGSEVFVLGPSDGGVVTVDGIAVVDAKGVGTLVAVDRGVAEAALGAPLVRTKAR